MSVPSGTSPAGEPDRPPSRAPGDASSGVPGVAEGDAAGGPGDDTYVARVARGAGISTLGQGFGRVIGYLVYAALGKLYGPAGVGLYSVGVGVANGANILARFGMDNGVVRYVAHYRARDDDARVRGTIIQSVLVTFALSLVLAALLFFGAGFAAEEIWKEPAPMATVFRWFAIALPFYTLMSMVLWATQGFQTVTYATYVQQLIRPALHLALIVAFYLVADSIVGAVAAFAASMLLGSVIALYYLRKLFPELLDNKVSAEYETRELFDVSVPMSITTLAQYANTWSALLILGVFATAGPTGIFQLAARTATFLTIVRFAFGGIFSPIISSFYARGEMENLGRMYKDVSRWIFTGGFALFLVIVVLGRDVLSAIRPGFAEGWTALVIVAAAQLYSSSVGPTPRMLAMTGNQRTVMVATAAAALTGIAVSFALAPGLQILGAAVGMASGIVAENTATLVAVRRRLGFWPYNREWLKPLASGLLAAGLAYLVNLVLPLPALVAIVVVGSVFGVAYLALLFLFGLSDTDKEFLGSFWNVARRYLRRSGDAEG